MFLYNESMKRVIIIHGWDGSSHKDWIPWVTEGLKKLGYEIFCPDMPHTKNPTIEDWVPLLSQVVGVPDRNTYFIGHSIGCQTILRYLDTHHFKQSETVGGAIFVAGWFNLENLEDKETEEIVKPWIETPIDFEKIKSVLPKSTLIISDNDPYGAFEENKKKFSALGSKIVVLFGAGHITAEDGFTELPLIFSKLGELQ